MKIKKDVLDKIIEHSKRDAPIEACGYLACQNDITVKHFELLNIDKSEEHFSFDPKDQFKVLKNAREENLEINAVYHSHPKDSSCPSREDIKLAYDSSLSYIIVSLSSQNPEVKSFKIKDSIAAEEILEVIENE